MLPLPLQFIFLMRSTIIVTKRKYTSKILWLLGLNHQLLLLPFYLISSLGNSLISRRFKESCWSTDVGTINQCPLKILKVSRLNKNSSLQIFQTRLNGISIFTFTFVPSAVFFRIQPKILIYIPIISKFNPFPEVCIATGSIFPTTTNLKENPLLIYHSGFF